MSFRVILIATAVSAFAAGCDCNGGGFPADARMIDAPAARGTVSLAWSLTDLTGQAITCDDVGASFVSLELRRQASVQGAVASFSCANSPSTSQPIEVGTYEVRFELRGQALTPVAAAPQNSVVITRDQNTELAPVTFPVDTNGMLVLAVVAPPFTSNCKPGSLQGAGITTNTITLSRAGGGCAPVTFVRTRGSTQLGTYMVNCSSPQISTCIENDETLTVQSMPSGPYQIHVRGKLGAVDCWANDDSLQVPAQGKARTETLNLAFQAGTPGC
jgi:hypothetical protein